MAKNKGCFGESGSFGGWIKSPTFAIYANYVLSAWGDWMWLFSAGLYLVFLADGQLRLAAIFGFTAGSLMLLLGGIIGNWVDTNGRMKVVVVSLFIQNISVALCATSVCLALVYHNEIYFTLGGHVQPLIEAIIIGLALVAFLASQAYKIAIEKDWIVVVAGGNKAELTNLNAVTRAIDLLCKIMAPTVAGLIMSYSKVLAAIVIAVWNIVSVFCEYALLRRVYRLVPKLAVKGDKETKEYEMKDMKDAEPIEKVPIKTESETEKPSEINSNHHIDDPKDTTRIEKEIEAGMNTVEEEVPKKCWQMMIEPFVTLVRGWKTYMKQNVVFAGLSLAFLYMTVLGFDYVTTGYIYANGVKESYVGIAMACGGVTGLLGTILFSVLNKRLGLERTGLFAFSSEILCLMLTVASIWAPGSVYDPSFSKPQPNCTVVNTSLPQTAELPSAQPALSYLIENSTVDGGRVKRDLYLVDLPNSEWQMSLSHFGSAHLGYEFPLSWSESNLRRSKRATDPAKAGEPKEAEAAENLGMRVTQEGLPSEGIPGEGLPAGGLPAPVEAGSTGGEGCEDNVVTVSIILFLVGIITSRIGLWMADLVVTQLLQENVAEMERGIVNGVQNSLNMLMDMIKNALVIAMPRVQTFGILIILSFIFVCIAGCLFVSHVTLRSDMRKGCVCVKSKTVVIDELDVSGEEKDAQVV